MSGAGGGATATVVVGATGGATAADVVTGRAVVVADAALVVVVGRALDASTSRATEAVVVVDVLLDCVPPPQPLMSAEMASAAIPRVVFFIPAWNQANRTFGIRCVTDRRGSATRTEHVVAVVSFVAYISFRGWRDVRST